MIEVWADEIATPKINGGLLRLRPGRLLISPQGTIKAVEKISASQFKTRSKKIIREKTIIPGLVDAHTHLVFAGNRADEFGMRLAGATYQEIAKHGGGILKTLKATREISEAELFKLAFARMKLALSTGITTIEIKSGYGLDLSSELKLLNVIDRLKKKYRSQIVSTFMGAHSVPKEFASSKAYTDYLIQKVLPKVKGRAEFQDVFCEEGYFSESESVALLEAGKRIGLKPKVHAHEFGRTGGVNVAVMVKAISADHLMEATDEDIARLKRAGVIPVALPGTSFFLGAKKFAPLKKFWEAGLKPAIASDFNPGTNPSLNLPLCGTIAAIHQGLSLEQVLISQTLHGAYALDLKDRGALEPSLKADFVALDAEGFEEMYYSYGHSKVASVYLGGKKVS